MYKIVKKERLNDVVELMEVHAPMVARKCEPGQFIILRVGEDGERIPLTIADYDREAETITIIYQIVGFSTRQLAKLNEGDEITDFVGPLGVPTDYINQIMLLVLPVGLVVHHYIHNLKN